MEHKRTGPNSSEITTHDGTAILFSYGEPVAARLPHGEQVRVDDYVSRTTERHITAFIPGAARRTTRAELRGIAEAAR